MLSAQIARGVICCDGYIDRRQCAAFTGEWDLKFVIDMAAPWLYQYSYRVQHIYIYIYMWWKGRANMIDWYKNRYQKFTSK